MKRAFIFLVLGPVTVALTASFAAVAISGANANGVAGFFAVALFFLTLPVAAVAGLVDGCLARAVPVLPRAPLTAIVGAMIAYALAFTLLHWFMPNAPLMFFAFGGAVSMGACSLLAHEYGVRQEPVAQTQGLPRPG